MKLTESQLRKIIREEISTLSEGVIDFTPTNYTVRDPGNGKQRRYEGPAWEETKQQGRNLILQWAQSNPRLASQMSHLGDAMLQELCAQEDNRMYSGGYHAPTVSDINRIAMHLFEKNLRTIQEGGKFLPETGMMNKQKYIFIFVNAPGAPDIPRAIFPIEMEKEAMAFRDKGNGYFEARVGNWKGFGEFPSIRNLKLLP